MNALKELDRIPLSNGISLSTTASPTNVNITTTHGVAFTLPISSNNNITSLSGVYAGPTPIDTIGSLAYMVTVPGFNYSGNMTYANVTWASLPTGAITGISYSYDQIGDNYEKSYFVANIKTISDYNTVKQPTVTPSLGQGTQLSTMRVGIYVDNFTSNASTNTKRWYVNNYAT